MYIETVKNLYLTPHELAIIKNCQDLLEEIIEDSNDTDLTGIKWTEITATAENLLNIYDAATEYS